MQPNLSSFLTTVRDYVNRNPLVLFFASSFVLLVFLIFVVMLFTPKSKPVPKDYIIPTEAVYPSGTSNTKNNDNDDDLTTQVNPKSGEVIEQPDEDFEAYWEYSPFEEEDLKNSEYNKSYQPNGTVMYTFPSENPNRPNIMIVRGDVTVLNRTLQFDTTLTDTIDYLGKPEYVGEGSHFWGKNATMYIYFDRGLAFTVDMTSKKVLEQMEFMPVPPNEFKKTYGGDIIGEIKKY